MAWSSCTTAETDRRHCRDRREPPRRDWFRCPTPDVSGVQFCTADSSHSEIDGANRQRRISGVTSRRSALAILVAALLLSACGPTGQAAARNSTPSLSPTQTALAWFQAINTDNAGAAKKLFLPSQRDQIAWMEQPAADQSTFSNIHCKKMKGTEVRANVLCTFVESASPTEGNPDTFWTISFSLSKTHKWLISNYGQG